jgi:hypothetical protein
MLNWIVNLHPYLAALIFLALWWTFGYVQNRFISAGFACITWLLSVIAITLALVRKHELGSFRWLLALVVFAGGSAWIFRFYSKHRTRGAQEMHGR